MTISYKVLHFINFINKVMVFEETIFNSETLSIDYYLTQLKIYKETLNKTQNVVSIAKWVCVSNTII